MQQPQPRLRRIARAAGLIGALALAPAAQATPFGGGTLAATTWSPVASTIYQHYYEPAAAANGKVYEVGATVEAYTPSTNSWAYATTDPTYHGYGAAAVTGADGRIYVLGGDSNPALAEAYNPTTNGWSTLAPMP